MTYDEQLKCVSQLHVDAIAQGLESAPSIDPVCSRFAIGKLQTNFIQSTNNDELSSQIDEIEFNKPLMCHRLNQSQNIWQDVVLEHNASKAVEKIDFTLVTQCSMTRLWMLSFVCKV
jgi:hypothetical protein